MVIFDHTHKKITESTFSFPEFFISMQKISLLHQSIFMIQSIWEFCNQASHAHFYHDHPKKFWSTFNFCESASKCKKSVNSICSFFRYSHFRVLSPDWSQPFLIILTPKIFYHLLLCVNLCQHAKNQLIPSVHSWDTVNFRVHRSD